MIVEASPDARRAAHDDLSGRPNLAGGVAAAGGLAIMPSRTW